MAYGSPSLIGGVFNETFAPGSLSYSDLLVNRQHDRARPLARLGSGLTLTDSVTELRATVVLPDTADGRDVRTLIDTNVLTGFSVEVQRDGRMSGLQPDQRIVRSAELVGLGIVDNPAHSSSLIAEVRAKHRSRHETDPAILAVMQRPASSTFTKSTTTIFTPAQLRGFVGLGVDVSYDPALARAFGAARAIVEDEIGGPIVASARTDRYPCFSQRLLLSQVVPDTATVTVKYSDDAGAEQTIAAADYAIDATARPTSIYFTDLPNVELYAAVRAPVAVAYTPRPTVAGPERHAIDEALMRLVQDTWDPSGQLSGPADAADLHDNSGAC